MGRRWQFLAAVAALGLGMSSAQAQDIVIATAGPMTGQLAALGEQFKRGAEAAVADINARGGVLGRKLKLEIGDDQCDPKQAVAVANQLATKKVAFVAGHLCSSSSIPASAVYNESEVLMMTPASTNPKLTDEAAAKGWQNVFRACGRDDAQGAIAGAWLAKEYKGKNVAVVHDKSAYGQGLADETRKTMNGAGLKDVMYEAVTAGDKDFTALISKMKAANVHAIFFGGYHTEAGLMLRQAREQGLNSLLVMGDALATDEFWKITGPAGQGTVFTFPPDPRKIPGAKATVDKIKAGGYDPEGYTLYTYAAIQAWAAAATATKSLKTADLAKWLRDNKVNTVIGNLGWDKKGDVTSAAFVWYIYKDGKYSEM
jgi:branched-chain amino acid transport system substrate-binding protein